MGRLNPYNLQMQITQMFTQGQSFFALTKVQDWLKEHNQNPLEYEVVFHQKPAHPGSKEVMVIEIELKRKDGQPVDPWLQAQVNAQK
jgi:dsRNA-specific ribonuclease